jgi:putative hemolysin
MRIAAALTTVLILAACSSPEPERVDSSSPTVTYKYYGDTYGSQFDEVSARAADYCNEQFGKSARLKDVDEGSGDENFAIFECV